MWQDPSAVQMAQEAEKSLTEQQQRPGVLRRIATAGHNTVLAALP